MQTYLTDSPTGPRVVRGEGTANMLCNALDPRGTYVPVFLTDEGFIAIQTDERLRLPEALEGKVTELLAQSELVAKLHTEDPRDTISTEQYADSIAKHQSADSIVKYGAEEAFEDDPDSIEAAIQRSRDNHPSVERADDVEVAPSEGVKRHLHLVSGTSTQVDFQRGPEPVAVWVDEPAQGMPEQADEEERKLVRKAELEALGIRDLRARAKDFRGHPAVKGAHTMPKPALVLALVEAEFGS